MRSHATSIEWPRADRLLKVGQLDGRLLGPAIAPAFSLSASMAANGRQQPVAPCPETDLSLATDVRIGARAEKWTARCEIIRGLLSGG